jgi:hypothetical protein
MKFDSEQPSSYRQKSNSGLSATDKLFFIYLDKTDHNLKLLEILEARLTTIDHR